MGVWALLLVPTAALGVLLPCGCEGVFALAGPRGTGREPASLIYHSLREGFDLDVFASPQRGSLSGAARVMKRRVNTLSHG